MPEREDDPIASTQMFRAFVQGGDADHPNRLRPGVITLILAVAVGVGVIAWLLLS